MSQEDALCFSLSLLLFSLRSSEEDEMEKILFETISDRGGVAYCDVVEC